MQKERLKVRRISIIFGIILFIVSLLLIYSGLNHNFTNSIYVITKDEDTNIVNYYEINERGKSRKKGKFLPDKMEEFTVSNCYKSYISGGKVLNRLNLDTCIIEDNTGSAIKITEEFKKIVKKVSNLEHSIFKNKIFRIDNEYYVVTVFNVNLWTPYCLYYYDRENDELKLLYTFKGEDIIGFKMK